MQKAIDRIWLFGIFEFVYFVIAVCIILFRDLSLMVSSKRKTRCAYGSLKMFLQSVMTVAGAILFSVVILDSIIKKKTSCGIEIVFAIIGGMLGNAFGFILFKYFPSCCLCCSPCRFLYDSIQNEDTRLIV